MKTRNGFVSNSSSSSFIVFSPKQIKSEEDMYEVMFPSELGNFRMSRYERDELPLKAKYLAKYCWKYISRARITLEEALHYKEWNKDQKERLKGWFENHENDYAYYYFVTENTDNDENEQAMIWHYILKDVPNARIGRWSDLDDLRKYSTYEYEDKQKNEILEEIKNENPEWFRKQQFFK
jgi:hypothetical protein